MILEAKKLSKIYGNAAAYRALDQFDLMIEKGEFVGIMGPSGSGKSTLLQLLGTIEQPSSGSLMIDGQDVRGMNQNQLADFRREKLGFIFQDFQLLDSLSIKENILIPLVLNKVSSAEMEDRVQKLASYLGIESILHKRPYEVSGGQKQRAAAARALIHNPSLVLADEPTGNLDSKSAKDLMEILIGINREAKTTILMVTHDPVTASYCNRILFIKDGKWLSEIYQGEKRAAFFEQILLMQSSLGGEQYDAKNIRL
ncbi:ABC transporter ATP-binding protein [Shimazuella sp. AN120528]|uniref:ABC transporter ATP-binding protein n=1 Tax=Shimazuella soli TaxID=1892854 RepID=UPI001F1185C2|nr:ABC transporter ATP-binding protein [Shimazuella soli]MCH5584767.1 ABC transporter ATP-binding protein [Shimazuella soli]